MRALLMMNVGRIVSVVGAGLLVSIAVGCGTSPQPKMLRESSPIVGGSTDSADNSVGMVYFADSTGAFVCTATEIANNVFLTAGHCTVKDDTCTPGTCSANAASGYMIYGGSSPMDASFNITSPTWEATVSEVHPDPNYDGQSLTGDVGILIVSNIKSDGGALPTPMAWLSSSDPSAYASGTSFKAVGYGETSTSGAGTGTKRSVTLTSQGTSGEDFQYGSSSKNTCSGDSGGPAIETIGGTPTVVGTTSYGDQNCSQFGADMRTDMVSSFISQYAAAAPTPTPTTTPSGTPTPTGTSTPNPTPTSTPSSNGNGNGNNGNGNGAGPKVGGCDVAGTAGSALGLLPILLPFGLALSRRKRG